VQRSWSASP
jgi:hypothetical protein